MLQAPPLGFSKCTPVGTPWVLRNFPSSRYFDENGSAGEDLHGPVLKGESRISSPKFVPEDEGSEIPRERKRGISLQKITGADGCGVRPSCVVIDLHYVCMKPV